MNKKNNGRIDIKSPNTNNLFKMYDKMPVNQCATFRDPTEGGGGGFPPAPAGKNC